MRDKRKSFTKSAWYSTISLGVQLTPVGGHYAANTPGIVLRNTETNFYFAISDEEAINFTMAQLSLFNNGVSDCQDYFSKVTIKERKDGGYKLFPSNGTGYLLFTSKNMFDPWPYNNEEDYNNNIESAKLAISNFEAISNGTINISTELYNILIANGVPLTQPSVYDISDLLAYA
ncbi:hypothetical protein ABGV42_01785 [Paenibacillus pabuli]|uniref:hypothetical protein n=1 Tax=Paenibacillus pabuli TaxID=1472 RepID=UPI0032428E14